MPSLTVIFQQIYLRQTHLQPTEMKLKVHEALKRKVRDRDKSVWGCQKNKENMTEKKELILPFIKNQFTDLDTDWAQAQFGNKG